MPRRQRQRERALTGNVIGNSGIAGSSASAPGRQ
jgi:hypothetical protein